MNKKNAANDAAARRLNKLAHVEADSEAILDKDFAAEKIRGAFDAEAAFYSQLREEP